MARTAGQKFGGWAAGLTVALVMAGCSGNGPTKARPGDASADRRDAAGDVRADRGDVLADRGDSGAGGASDGATDRGDTAPNGSGGMVASDAGDSGAGGAPSGVGGAADSGAGGAGTGGMGSGGMGTGGTGTGGAGTGGSGTGGTIVGTGGTGTGGTGTGGTGTGGTIAGTGGTGTGGTGTGGTIAGTGGTGTGGTGTGGTGTGGTGTGGTGTGGTGTGGDADAGTDVPADSGGGDLATGGDSSDAGDGCGVGCPANLRPALPAIWLTADVGVQCDGSSRVTGWSNRGSNGGIFSPPGVHPGPRCAGATSLGGRSVVVFDAPNLDDLDGVLTVDLTPLVAGSGYTVFAVERRQSDQEGYFLGTTLPLVQGILCADDPDGNSHAAYRFGYDDLHRLQSGPYIGDSAMDCPIPDPPPAFLPGNPQASLDIEVFDPAVGHSTFSNGALLVSDTDVGPVTLPDGFIGRAFNAVMNTRHSRFHGDIAEIIIYAATLSQTEIDQVSGYLTARWGLPH